MLEDIYKALDEAMPVQSKAAIGAGHLTVEVMESLPGFTESLLTERHSVYCNTVEFGDLLEALYMDSLGDKRGASYRLGNYEMAWRFFLLGF